MWRECAQNKPPNATIRSTKQSRVLGWKYEAMVEAHCMMGIGAYHGIYSLLTIFMRKLYKKLKARRTCAELFALE